VPRLTRVWRRPSSLLLGGFRLETGAKWFVTDTAQGHQDTSDRLAAPGRGTGSARCRPQQGRPHQAELELERWLLLSACCKVRTHTPVRHLSASHAAGPAGFLPPASVV
jgi:hypothetical protein